MAEASLVLRVSGVGLVGVGRESSTKKEAEDLETARVDLGYIPTGKAKRVHANQRKTMEMSGQDDIAKVPGWFGFLVLTVDNRGKADCGEVQSDRQG